MKRIFSRMCALGLAALVGCLIILVLPPKPDNIFLSTVDKHALLLNIPSPKIILIGGSSVALGVDSSIIAQETNLPVVNMGINGGFGMRYMLDEVRRYVNSEDIIVLAAEYDHFYGDLLDGDLNLLWAVTLRSGAWADISSAGQVKTILYYMPSFIQIKAQSLLPSRRNSEVYQRSSFNTHGDFVGHLGLSSNSAFSDIQSFDEEPFNSNAIDVVKDFKKFASTRRACVLYTFPPLAETRYKFSENPYAVKRVAAALEDIPGLLLVGQPESRVYRDDLFYDTAYHLGADGRIQHSRGVARDIAEVLSSCSEVSSSVR